MLEGFQIGYWIIGACFAASNLYFAWRRHRRDAYSVLHESRSKLEAYRAAVRSEVIDIFSLNLINVRHLHLGLDAEERLRMEFEFLLDKPDVVGRIRRLHEKLLWCEGYDKRIVRARQIQALVTSAAVLSSAGCIMPLFRKLTGTAGEFTSLNLLALIVVIELVASSVGLGLYRSLVHREFERSIDNSGVST